MKYPIKNFFALSIVLSIGFFSSCKKDDIPQSKLTLKPKYIGVGFDSFDVKDYSIGKYGANRYQTTFFGIDEDGNYTIFYKDSTMVYGSIIGLGPSNTLYNLIWSRNKKLILRTFDLNNNALITQTTLKITPAILDLDEDVWRASKLIYNPNDGAIYFANLYRYQDSLKQTGLYRIDPSNGNSVQVISNSFSDFTFDSKNNLIYFTEFSNSNGISEYNINSQKVNTITSNYNNGIYFCSNIGKLYAKEYNAMKEVDMINHSANKVAFNSNFYNFIYATFTVNNTNTISEIDTYSQYPYLSIKEYDMSSLNQKTIITKEQNIGNSFNLNYIILANN